MSGQHHVDESLLRSLRERAARGAACRDLVGLLRQELDAPEGMVPILAYLCRAFEMPLPTLLPLKEDGGLGAFGRAVQVSFWFAAALHREGNVQEWDWDVFHRAFPRFSADALRTTKVPGGFMAVLDGDDGRYVRSSFETLVDKQESFDPSEGEVFRRVEDFVKLFLETWNTDEEGDGSKRPWRLKFESRVEDQGPKFRVTCMAQGLRSQTCAVGAGDAV